MRKMRTSINPYQRALLLFETCCRLNFLKTRCRSITYKLTFIQCQLDDNNVVQSVSVDSAV